MLVSGKEGPGLHACPCYGGDGQERWKNWTMAFVCVAGSGHACGRDKHGICYLTGKLSILLLRLETATYAEHWTHAHRTNLKSGLEVHLSACS